MRTATAITLFCAFAVSLACNAATGLNDLEFTASSSLSSGGSSATGSTIGGTGGTTSASGEAATTAGGGTVPTVCGDGIVGTGEECDDMNDEADDGCDACICEHKNAAATNCYVSTSGTSSWAESQSDCLARGANLPTLQTDAERLLVSGLVDAKFAWLGAQDVNIEGSFEWITGEPWLADAWWAADQPDGGALENCVRLTVDATLEDLACSASARHACEWPLGPQTE